MADRIASASAAPDPMADALQHLSQQFSLTRQEWRNHYRGGDALLDGLVSHGYAIERGGRFAVSQVGRVRMEA